MILGIKPMSTIILSDNISSKEHIKINKDGKIEEWLKVNFHHNLNQKSAVWFNA